MPRPGGSAVGAAVLACGMLAAGAAASPATALSATDAAPRIVGGAPAETANWGFTAAILRRGRMHCTGSVIAPTRVLTAAHCVQGFNLANLLVLTGRSRIGDAATGEALGVASATIAPDFGVAPPHDVAVITLASPTSAPPIRLAGVAEDATATVPGALLGAAGFGQRNPFIFGKPRIGVLTETTQEVKGDCTRLLGPAFVPRSTICAIGSRVSRKSPVHRGACFGDSGGPLVVATGAGLRLVGVASEVTGFAFGCGIGGAPNLYSRVSDDLPFISAAAGLSPPVDPLVAFSGTDEVRAARTVGFPFVCGQSCSVSTSATLLAEGLDRPPTLSTVQLAAGETGAATLPIGRRGVRALRRFPGLAAVLVKIEAVNLTTGATDSHSRIFGFKR